MIFLLHVFPRPWSNAVGVTSDSGMSPFFLPLKELLLEHTTLLQIFKNHISVLARMAARLPVTAWKPARMLATEHRLPQDWNQMRNTKHNVE